MTRSIVAQPRGFQGFEFGRRHGRRVSDQRLQPRREAFDFRRPVGEQRCRRHQQARLRLRAVLALEHQQQRKHLDGLAESHVVGQARPETEFREQVKPAHAHLLVGPQRALQRVAGVDLRQALRSCAALSESPQARGRPPPAPSRHRPRRPYLQRRPLRPRRPTGAWPRRRPGRSRSAVRSTSRKRSIMLCRCSRSISTHRPRTSASPSDPGQQVANLRGGERFAVKRDIHTEIEQRVLSQPGRRLGAHRARHLRPRRTVAAPRRRHAHHHARRLQLRDVPQKLQGLPRRPAQRMKDLARIDHGLQPGQSSPTRAAPEAAGTAGGPCSRRPRIRAAPGPAADAAPWPAPTAASYRSREMRTAHPGSLRFSATLKCTRPTRFQAGLRRFRNSCTPHLDSASSIAKAASEFLPQSVQHRGRQIFGARHRRRCRAQCAPVLRLRGRNAHTPGVLLPGADRGHVACAEFAPIGIHRRKRRPHFVRAQQQNAVARTAFQSDPQAVLQPAVKRRGAVVVNQAQAGRVE